MEGKNVQYNDINMLSRVHSSRELEEARLKEILVCYIEKVESLERELAFERKKCHTDPLTGLPTLEGVFEEVENYLSLFKRKNNFNLSVVFIDMDGLKPINDRFGHDVGDDLIDFFAQTLVKSVRAEDLLCRRTMGGDEFIVVLPNQDISGATGVVQKIKKSLQEEKVYEAFGEKIPISASFGTASATPKTKNLFGLFREAEKRMYKEKEKKLL